MNKIIIAAVVLVIVGGGYLLLSSNKNGQVAPEPSEQTLQPSPTSTGETTESPSEEVKEEASITLSEDGFSPATLTIKVGSKVTWTNSSGVMANVSSVPHPTHTTYPPLNLGQFADGEALSLTFDKAGTYGYHNHLDASQKGTIVVE